MGVGETGVGEMGIPLSTQGKKLVRVVNLIVLWLNGPVNHIVTMLSLLYCYSQKKIGETRKKQLCDLKNLSHNLEKITSIVILSQ